MQKVVSHPMDVISVRVAIGINSQLLGGDGLYGGIFDCTRRVLVNEGIAGFYKGFLPTLLTGVPYVMLQMTLFELFRRYGALRCHSAWRGCEALWADGCSRPAVWAMGRRGASF